ncbi:ArsR/SmtB family transcription factor [Aurantiacibacter rhizosphaerae]|uniref:Metalloregulator ArsR/SmtB family transcription factor n=1 Tax=Aurantiacibacter rhizosphaerae TaxID=2691582 RepID=A0A844XBK6_9SPHN|nr:metalloregulator ArsR/SmtB family transcription factor [Aurantiacibacter rhizosphaerae]MWV27169.1 metalloregulator ArsR/SmtB family transcription factor [Aurantiacibacter rhizosphaerae]
MADDMLLEALKALAHPSRLRILQAIAGGECNVGEIEEATGVAQPTLSQQLAILRKAGLVQTRRQAKLVYYSPDGDAIASVARSLGDLAPETALSHPDPHTETGARRPAPGVANFARLNI